MGMEGYTIRLRSCAFSVDTPSNPRVSFLFHMILLCPLEDLMVASCWLLSSQVLRFRYLKPSVVDGEL
jgi:hypothetical protein